MSSLSSRERLLRALSCQPVDYHPCCFMLAHSLDEICANDRDLVDKQLEWGLDPLVILPSWFLPRPGDPKDLRGYQFDYPEKVNVTLRGLPVHAHADVQVRESSVHAKGDRYPLLRREYITPEGALSVEVKKTADWPYGDRMLFVDDFIIARAKKNLVNAYDDLKALKYLLQPPDREAIDHFRSASQANRKLAREKGLPLVYQWGVLGDMAAWLCGLQELMLFCVDQRDLVMELLHQIADWNLSQMRVVLDEGIDIWVRRGWYEGCDFWSPKMYRQFILPHLKREVEVAHDTGVKFVYIMTKGAMPILDMILEAGVDALFGPDPIQGDIDMHAVKAKARGRLCLWGGINGPLTIEAGTKEQIEQGVKEAIDALSPGDGFILSPVDGIYDSSTQTWDNVRTFVDAWKRWR